MIIDNSQAFYAPPSNDSWSLYSARKFFGVADGAYLWGKEKHESFPRRTDRINTAFLKARSRGDVEEGYQEFRKNEELLDSEILSPTEESEAVLAQVDHPLIMGRRLENYALLHEALGAENQLSVDLAEGDIPLCYPFLPSRSVDRSILHSKKIFVPTYWQHAVDNRPDSFSWERDLSQRMLPLPVDQTSSRCALPTS